MKKSLSQVLILSAALLLASCQKPGDSKAPDFRSRNLDSNWQHLDSSWLHINPSRNFHPSCLLNPSLV